MNFLELAKQRCTTRGFKEQGIKSEELRYILSAARVAPSACNRQPQRIIAVQQPDNIDKVQKAYKTFGSQCVLIVCRDTRNELIRPFDGKCSGDLDIGIVCDHIMLSARELGIGSVMVGLFDPAIIRQEFNIPPYIEPTALLFLGYPVNGFLDPERHDTERKKLEETVMYETYNEHWAKNNKRKQI
jgi:nitroreductase